MTANHADQPATPVPAPVSAEANGLSQWSLIRRRFSQHRLAVVSFFALQVIYLVAGLGDFFAPYPKQWRNLDFSYCPPQQIRWDLEHGLHVHAMQLEVDPVTFERRYRVDRNRAVPLSFFARGTEYRFWGIFNYDRHFLGVNQEGYRQARPADSEAPPFYLLGADLYGHDILSRIILGAQISLSIGLVSIFSTFLIGITVGGISGYMGGRVDSLIQRGIEVVNSLPQLPLWLALSAAMPREWSAIQAYFAITIVLSVMGWTGLARVVRGKLLSLREEDYVVAARLMGASHARILCRHLLPGFTSHIVVAITMSIPGMILGETALSFIGLGLRSPVVSWGVMLQPCIDLQVLRHYPWMIMPVVAIALTVLAFNFLGDGLRDAADPYSTR